MKKLLFIFIAGAVLIAVSCARMGSPDGGWYDEKPPVVLGTYPSDGSVNIKEKKVRIAFDEYVVIDNATENVIISPPQIEQADIKTKGKSIIVELEDSLKENTTYTIDFSSAIKDNNEGNVMGNFTYSFSTGEAIDTMQTAGYVLDAETLEPLESVLVGLYAVSDTITEDTAIVNQFHTEPMLRVARTDAAGHFSIKGVKPGEYRIYALNDVDGNFLLTPGGGEQTAFFDETIVPTVVDDTRQDTTWLDSLRIKSIDVVEYKHYLPDNITLRAFTEEQTTRNFIKSDRTEEKKFSLIYSYGDSLLPDVRGLNFTLEGNYITEVSEKKDTVTYWLTDTTLVNTDSLEIEMTYRMTDTLGVLVSQTDTLTLLPKISYERRLKLKQDDYDDWLKKENKKKKRGQPYDSVMPPPELKFQSNLKNTLDPDQNITYEFETPVELIDTTKIHLYIKRDTLWYNARWLFEEKAGSNIRTYELKAEWQPGCEYSVELDSAAFVDIYGNASKGQKNGLRVKALEEFGTLQVNIPALAGQPVLAQLMEQGEKVVKEYRMTDGVAKFWFLSEKDYFLRVIVDRNDNGKWDSGRFDSLLQPEEVYYYSKPISCRAKWDITETWNPFARPLNEQKPSQLRKGASSSRGKTTQTNKNAQRAEKLGIELPEYLK
ncbi:MAG: Ig-like domain-containing protein [Prevotella sp.]|nr:Ig-like domain-containing protein [Prevotella sp.]